MMEHHWNLGWIGDPEDDLQVSFTHRSLTDLQTIQISQSQLVKVSKPGGGIGL